ncbi:MAG: fructose-bisphosphate aldolase class I [Bacteroidia bacterium]|nr:fructose-bisphosphate aldolase class I [Bacteroidia bacterium]
MNKQLLIDTVMQLLAGDKGLLAMDESNSTCNKRFAALGIPQTVEARQRFREWIVTTPGLNESISGAILFDETIRQQTKDGIQFTEILEKAGIIPGIKVDMGAKEMAGFPNEKITEGLDGLRNRLEEYAKLGARFAKWRAVITIGDGIPTDACIDANVHALARYAALCQEAGMVPVVEPEVLMDGNHTLQRSFEVTQKLLRALFNQLYVQKIFLEGMLLKPNMIIAGKDAVSQNSADEIAEATVDCLLQSVPAIVPGIAFLSGGQSPQEASEHLNVMNKNFKSKLPWVLTFSFSRAIEHPAIDIWKGQEGNVTKAQISLYHRAKLNAAASHGEYNFAMEKI